MNMADEKSKLIECFVRAIQAYVTTTENSMMSYFSYIPNMLKWYSTENLGFKLCNVYIPNCQPENIPEMNEKWNDLIDSVRNYAPFSGFLTKGMYTETGGGGCFSIDEYFYQLIPRLIVNSSGNLIFDRTHNLGQEVADFVDSIDRRSTKHITLVPIIDIRADSKINIDENVEFREFTQFEKEELLNYHLISPPLHLTDLSSEFCDWHGLVIKHSTEISTNPQIMEKTNQHIEIENKIDECIENFLISAVFSLEDKKMFSLLNSRMRRISYSKNFIIGNSIIDDEKFNNTRYMYRELKHNIDTAGQAAIFDVLNFIKEQKSKETDRIKLAMKRLYFSKTRRNESDRILDLMIAAEILYSQPNQSEIALRLSLNAAHYADDADKLTVYNSFKNAYSIRSKIVHEGNSKKREEIAQISNEVEKYLIQGIKKTIREIQQGTYRPTDSITDMLSKLSSIEGPG